MNLIIAFGLIALAIAAVIYGVITWSLPNEVTGEKGNVTFDLRSLPEINILTLATPEPECEDGYQLKIIKGKDWCAKPLKEEIR